MSSQSVKSVVVLTQEFFSFYPDYPFCRTLAQNIREGTTNYATAIELLSKKAWAARENNAAIARTLDQKKIAVDGVNLFLKDLSLGGLSKVDDVALKEAALFYLKHPYAHNRTKKTKWLPRFLRTLFLSGLVGHAHGRKLDLDYDAFYDLLRLL